MDRKQTTLDRSHDFKNIYFKLARIFSLIKLKSLWLTDLKKKQGKKRYLYISHLLLKLSVTVGETRIFVSVLNVVFLKAPYQA